MTTTLASTAPPLKQEYDALRTEVRLMLTQYMTYNIEFMYVWFWWPFTPGTLWKSCRQVIVFSRMEPNMPAVRTRWQGAWPNSCKSSLCSVATFGLCLNIFTVLGYAHKILWLTCFQPMAWWLVNVILQGRVNGRSRPNQITGPGPKSGPAGKSESRGPEYGVLRWRRPNSDIYSQN